MKKKSHKTEFEIRISIDEDKLDHELSEKVSDFTLVSKYSEKVEDVLYERRGRSFKADNIGLRLRKKSSGVCKLTYKRFLGSDGSVAKFDEVTKKINKDKYDEIRNSDLSLVSSLVEKNDVSSSQLYELMVIDNKRKIFIYKKDDIKIKMFVEDVTYINNGNIAKDAMIEIESMSSFNNKEMRSVERFAQKIINEYGGKIVNEGKNVRGVRFLGLSQ